MSVVIKSPKNRHLEIFFPRMEGCQLGDVVKQKIIPFKATCNCTFKWRIVLIFKLVLSSTIPSLVFCYEVHIQTCHRITNRKIFGKSKQRIWNGKITRFCNFVNIKSRMTFISCRLTRRVFLTNGGIFLLSWSVGLRKLRIFLIRHDPSNMSHKICQVGKHLNVEIKSIDHLSGKKSPKCTLLHVHLQ